MRTRSKATLAITLALLSANAVAGGAIKERPVYAPGVPGVYYRTSIALILVGADHEGHTAFTASANKLQRLLTSDWEFPAENVRVQQVRSREDARRELAWLEANTTDEDRVLVVIIAHGVGAPQEPPVLDLGQGSGRYRMDEAIADFAKVRARHKLLVLDACQSGSVKIGAAAMETDPVRAKQLRSAGVILTSDSGRDTAVTPTGTRFVDALVREVMEASARAAHKAQGLWLSDVVTGKHLGYVRFGTVEGAESCQFLLDPLPVDQSVQVAGLEFRQFDPEQEPERRKAIEKLRRLLMTEDLPRAERAIRLLHLASALRHEQHPDKERESLREAVAILQNIKDLPDEYAEDYRLALAAALLAHGSVEADIRILQRAVDACRAVLASYSRAEQPEKWAIAQLGLGIALSACGQFGDARALKDARAAVDRALEVFTRENNPEKWAQTQTFLGWVLLAIGERGDGQALRDAHAAVNRALEVFTRENNPEMWVATQTLLGCVLWAIGERGDGQALRDARAALSRALEVFTRENNPKMWVATQTLLGRVLLLIGARGDGQALKDARAAVDRALEVFTRENNPGMWAWTQTFLGRVLLVIGVRGDGQALKDARAAVDRALEVYTRENNPEKWADTQILLGSVLWAMGAHGNARALRDARAAVDRALEVYTRENNPEEWARTQVLLGSVLLEFGRRGDRKALWDAHAAVDRALEVYTRENNPEMWARTQVLLGWVLLELDMRGDSLVSDGDVIVLALEYARAALNRALEVFTRENNPEMWAQTQITLGRVLLAIGTGWGGQALEDARAALSRALEVFTRENNPEMWAETQILLGSVLCAMGAHGNARALRDARAALSRALEVFTRENNPEKWAQTQTLLGWVLLAIGELGNARALRDARAAVNRALEVFTRENNPEMWAGAQFALGMTFLIIANRDQDKQAAREALKAFDLAAEVYKAAGFAKQLATIESLREKALAIIKGGSGGKREQ
jgi:tetratricopeptide (TPR) repeat protein